MWYKGLYCKEKNSTLDEIIDEYKVVQYKKENYYGNSLDSFVSSFLKGIECDRYVFELNSKEHLSNESYVYPELLKDGEQFACFSQDNIKIRSNDKRIVLYSKDYVDYAYNDVMKMHHSTDEGLYCFLLKAQVREGKVEKYVYDLLHYPNAIGENKINVGAQEPWCFVTDSSKVAYFEPVDIAEEDIPKLANKLFREGLKVFHEKLNKGESFEIIEHERESYNDSMEKTIEIYESVEENNAQKNESIPESLNIKQVVEVLMLLKKKGIELSEEQKNMINLYSDVVSENYEKVNETEEEVTKRK